MRTTQARLLTPSVLALFALLGLASPSARAWQDAPTDPVTEEPAVEPAEQPADPLMDWGDAPAERPARRIVPTRAEQPAQADPTVSFGVFSEPLQLTTLIDFVGSTLGINIVVKGSPTGEVVFNAPVEVPQSRLMDLLDAMLEQYGFTVTHEPATGFYIVQPVTDVRPTIGGDRSSVRIIPTPNIKASQIANALSGTIGSANTTSTIQPVDELGVIIVTAPARDIARVESLVAELMAIIAQQQYIRFELNHIAAPAARDRAVGLVGGGTGTTGGLTLNQNQQIRGNRQQEGQPSISLASGGSFSNLTDRITIDPQGNALIFRGTDVEIDQVREILKVIDVPNTLKPRNYFAGSSASQIANMAKLRGLGEVIEVTDQTANQNNSFGNNFRIQQQLQQGLGTTDSTAEGGPIMVVDVSRGNIIYYGTPEQQTQLADLMKELGTADEQVVIREYVLNHSDAETVADLLTGIITGQRQTGNDGTLLPTATGANRGLLGGAQEFIPGFGVVGGDDVSAAFDPDVVVVIPDPENNQVVVKAPIKQQGELAKLIERLDRRRAQVYLQALIVSVSDNEDYTLGFETQIKAGQFGINTDFDLGGFPAGSDFTDPKQVGLDLGGLTAAVIQSEYVPIIINANQTNTDVRILSSPQLLVNDNEEAEIVSIEEQPYNEVTNDNGVSQTGFAGFAEAGTTLRVTPSISDGGFLRLEYYVELSNFTSTEGAPPPRNTRTVTGKATIPSDATIVVGGLTVEDVRDTVIKVPFIGDIPIVGELFKKTNKVNNKAKLYVFLTPRIMTDPNFNDLKLLTQGPQTDMEIDPDAPPLEPEAIRSLPNGTAPSATPVLEPATID